MPAVLVAARDARDREVVGAALRLEGHWVVEAADSEAAWRDLRAQRVTAALVDAGGPESEWLTLVTSIREDQGLRDVPVIALTREGDDGEAARRAGADRVVPRPLTVAAVRDAVEEAIAERAGRGEG